MARFTLPALALLLLSLILMAFASDAPTTQPGDDSMVSVYVFNGEGRLVGPVQSPKVVKTDAEWQKQLTPKQYEIARAKGTEPAFCGLLLNNKEPGVYSCICCGLPLFSSDSKFHSGTGWPSFFQPIAKENVIEHEDRSYGMVRTEVLCARCGAHLGHVFDDGPRPTGLRFCLNSESIKFTPSTDLAQLADPATHGPTTRQSASAVFAGGCFWCTEAVFEDLRGVTNVESGYSGGTAETAKYKIVCTGVTGHAEAIRITYDPSIITYDQLLDIFFAAHDPTQLNGQGADIGTQYRSAIFYADESQKKAAERKILALTESHAYPKPIITSLEPLRAFYPAEDYHQDYAELHPDQPYIACHALPNAAKVRERFAKLYK
ncbi:MAG: bifunctional methionine sulfoxide reductase B/A protein [Phycisphaerales bacterium]|jgi:peptide methionine sulfoxide reductase msrA/msrB|nr:bifunctional methionine sulfoxide reductase B/A protein [Phycisphaerales bacterium]